MPDLMAPAAPAFHLGTILADIQQVPVRLGVGFEGTMPAFYFYFQGTRYTMFMGFFLLEWSPHLQHLRTRVR
jgi:hypothetical protein